MSELISSTCTEEKNFHHELAGTFEWLCDYNYLKNIFQTLINEYFIDQNCIRVLEVGCGTSTLAIDLYRAYPSRITVHSIDNDADCIRYMKDLYSDEKALTWMVYDMIECPDVPNKSNLLRSQSFDIIVDKGSLDAMLVEGCISPMLCEVYRLLKPKGVYFLCSLHPPQLIEPLFSQQPLHLKVEFPDHPSLVKGTNHQKHIALCTKQVNSSCSIDLESMLSTEDMIMSNFFQNENPILTEAKKTEIENYYKSRGSKPFSLIEAHAVITSALGGGSFPICESFSSNSFITDAEGLDYTFDLFQDDLCDFSLADSNCMTLDELFLFISLKQ